jgi:predicted amidohydrolase YtcJ
VGGDGDTAALPRFTPAGDFEDLAVRHVKIVSDGSNQGLTGYQESPYCCEPADNVGAFNYCDPGQPRPSAVPAAFQRLVSAACDKGWPVMVHANGAAAVELTLRALEAATAQAGPARHRIEHCSLLTPAQLDRMKAAGVSPSFLPGHVGFWGHVFQQAILGPQRAEALDMAGSALRRGLRISGHSDCSVTPLGPLRVAEQLCTRVMEGDPARAVLGKDECLSLPQALCAVTYDAAWQCGADAWCGSLEPGKHADMVLLEADPLLCAPAALRDIRVLRTLCEGVETYRCSAPGPAAAAAAAPSPNACLP